MIRALVVLLCLAWSSVAFAQSDFAITKTDGVTTATPGGSVTYTITASNAGPSAPVGSVTVADTFLASLTCNWTCVGAGGGTCTASGAGNINDTVNLPVGGSVTYTASCSISASASGNLSNTATVNGANDSTPGNNSATDTDTLVASADVGITKTDGVTTATPGGSVTYTISAYNAGPSNTSATVADTFPAALTCSWTCIGAGGGNCTASSTGDINDTVNLPAGGSVTYTASCTINPSATGTLGNTATVAGSASDPVPGNNSATDNDTLQPDADLAITVSDGVTTVTTGGSLTYTIIASNPGPSAVVGGTVTDTFPSTLNCTWTCVGSNGGTCTASGSGDIADTVNLPAGSTVQYTASCARDQSVAASLSNTVTVQTPVGTGELSPADNTATDTDAVWVSVDLSATISDAATTVEAGAGTTYTLTVSNAGPHAAPGSVVSATFGGSATWTCVGAGGGTCTASGGGNINDTLNLPVGASVTYTVIVQVPPDATGDFVALASTALAAGYVDVSSTFDAATDTDSLAYSANLAITKSDGVAQVSEGASVTYNIVVSNSGPSTVTGAHVQDALPATLGGGSWTCVGTGGAICTASGSGDIDDFVTVPPGGEANYTLVATNLALAGSSVINSATVESNPNAPDPVLSNNTAVDTDTVVAVSATGATGGTGARPTYDLAIALTSSTDKTLPSTSVDFVLTVTNNGPLGSPAVVAAVTVPDRLKVQSLPKDCTFGGAVLACAIPALANNESKSYAFSMLLDDALGSGVELSVFASLTGLDQDASNDSVTVTITSGGVVLNDLPEGERGGCNAGGAGSFAGLLLLLRRRRSTWRR